MNEQNLSAVSRLCINAENLEKNASVCDSLVDIFAEALESMHANGTQPVDGATYGNVAEVIRTYSSAVKHGVQEVRNSLSNLKCNMRDKGGECHE